MGLFRSFNGCPAADQLYAFGDYISGCCGAWAFDSLDHVPKVGVGLAFTVDASGRLAEMQTVISPDRVSQWYEQPLENGYSLYVRGDNSTTTSCHYDMRTTTNIPGGVNSFDKHSVASVYASGICTWQSANQQKYLRNKMNEYGVKYIISILTVGQCRDRGISYRYEQILEPLIQSKEPFQNFRYLGTEPGLTFTIFKLKEQQ